MKNLNLKSIAAFSLLTFSLLSCEKEEMKDDDDNSSSSMQSMTINYEFNNGQTVSTAPYDGDHWSNLTAKMELEEKSDNMTEITVTLMNTIDGEMYMVHAHDAADPSSTPNGTPYNETPNSDILAKMVTGNGGTVSVTQTANISYDSLTTAYEGFFVVHDPLQTVSTTDISTYLVVSSFARQAASSNLKSMDFDYDFNTGQVNAAYAYSGSHATNLMGKLRVDELANGESRVSVMLMNSLNGEMYMIHAHDAADPTTTPNGTPYDESPNSDVMTQMVTGNGGSVMVSQKSSMSYDDITMNYSGFFVVHDPLQSISTTDPTTYVLLGSFAR